MTAVAPRVVIVQNRDFSPGPSGGALDERARADVARVAESVRAALEARGYRAELLTVDAADVASAVLGLARAHPCCVFNLCESLAGDARHEVVVPTLLELYGIPYTGSPSLALSLALRKEVAKALLEAAGIATPRAVVVERPGEPLPPGLALPLIVKPTREDGSVGISSASVVWDRGLLDRRVREALDALRQPLLVEQYVEGRELNVSLLGAPPHALPIHEIDFSEMPADRPRIVTYDAKWDEASPEFGGTRSVEARGLSDELARRVEAIAVAAFRALGLRGYGRVDLRLAADGTPFVIDVNPNCDLAVDAGFARAARAGGLGYEELIAAIVEDARRGRPHADPHARAA